MLYFLYFLLGNEAVVIENQDEGQDDSVEDSLHQRSSMTPERLKLYLVTQERTRTVFVSRNATLEELKRFVHTCMFYVLIWAVCFAQMRAKRTI